MKKVEAGGSDYVRTRVLEFGAEKGVLQELVRATFISDISCRARFDHSSAKASRKGRNTDYFLG